MLPGKIKLITENALITTNLITENAPSTIKLIHRYYKFKIDMKVSINFMYYTKLVAFF